jgi:lamin B
MGSSFMLSQSSANAGYQASGTSSGAIEIAETDSEGKFVKLQNSSDKDVSLAGYRLEHHAGGEETAYKFHRNIVLKAGDSCTVWSSDSDTTHNPPTDLVMKGKRFFVADSMKTMIYDSDGQEIATREMKKSVKRTSYFSSTSALSSREAINENPERCTVM